MKKALFAGSFNPPTVGHKDTIRRASVLVDKLYVGIAENSAKSSQALPIDLRLRMLHAICSPHSNVEIITIPGLVAEMVKKYDLTVLIRSLRSHADLEQEFAMAFANKQLCGVETLFLMAEPCHAHVSSTLVREIASLGGPLQGFIPDELISLMQHERN